MTLVRSSLVSLILAGILALGPTAAFAGGGHGDGHHFGDSGGGHAGGTHSGYFAGFDGHSFAYRGGEHYRFYYRGHRYRGWHGYPYGCYDYPYSCYYSLPEPSAVDISTWQQTVIAVQKELTALGYYHGSIDGVIGPETQSAVRCFQSMDGLPVTGNIDSDSATLKALKIS